MPGPLRHLAAYLLPVLLAAGLIGGCGGDDDTADVTELLDRAFKSPIPSADVKLDVQLELDGVDELEDAIQLTLAGPYEGGGDRQIPSVDWEITVSAQNQSFNAGLISTGDRAFVAFQGTDYEVSRATVRALNRRIAASNGDDEPRDLSDFGVSARDWVVDAEEDGDEEIAGVDTTHVSAKLDVSRVLEDLNEVVQQASELGGQIGETAPPQLTDEQKEQVEEVVDDPRFDVYVGKDDDTIRRLSADIEFDVPEDSRERVGGLEGGRISFSIEFADVGGEQTFQVPEGARPISELTSQLQGLLGGALGGAVPPDGSGAAPPDGAGEPAPQTDPEKQQAYEDCLRTDPDDPQVQAFCEVLLQ